MRTTVLTTLAFLILFPAHAQSDVLKARGVNGGTTRLPDESSASDLASSEVERKYAHATCTTGVRIYSDKDVAG